MESYIHGTVVANTDSWVFFFTFFNRYSSKNPTYIGVIELSFGWGGNWVERKEDNEKVEHGV